MRFAIDKNNVRVCIDDVDKGEVFYCQECGEKLVQRRGEIKAHHFAHFPNTQCIDTWHYDESDWHYQMQNLFPNEMQEIVMDLENKKHRADVFIKERNLVVEFQGDRIRQTEFASRNEFFTKLGPLGLRRRQGYPIPHRKRHRGRFPRQAACFPPPTCVSHPAVSAISVRFRIL